MVMGDEMTSIMAWGSFTKRGITMVDFQLVAFTMAFRSEGCVLGLKFEEVTVSSPFSDIVLTQPFIVISKSYTEESLDQPQWTGKAPLECVLEVLLSTLKVKLDEP